MGVHGLWDLLAPVGRRVSVETLAGKKLAIDASIWLVQFMKAMRDEKGDMVRNAHLLGFFRRICKLLYLRTKPVFVFDGGTPALKRRTVIARRRQRENAKAKIRKTAEKLLLNQLKTMRLKELASNLEKQKQNKDDGSNDKDLGSENHGYEKLDEMLAASIAAEDGGTLHNNASTSAVVEEMDSDEDEEMILPGLDENVDPSVFAALPPSMQLELLMRQRSMAEEGKSNPDEQVENLNEKHKNNGKGKEILSDQTDKEGNNLGSDHVAVESCNREELDEMLAASMVAEEEGGDEDEEMILPHGKVDPAVLASLPPSMQLDLLVQMRERLMAENRQRYQKVKKVPEKFSELQIQAYLKTVAFRREIDQVQKAAAGNGLGGVQASRIASESNREFIFSSSFSGDKQLLTSAGVKRKKGDEQQKKPAEQPSLDFVGGDASSSKCNNVRGLVMDKPRRPFDDDVVETYLDERGRVRVSRVRAMGVRMTRDLQRNLDLMKEIEKENTIVNKTPTAQSVLNINRIGSPNGFPRLNQRGNSSHGNSGNFVNLEDSIGKSFMNNETSMQISFEVGDGSKSFDNDDDIFASLVDGKPVNISSDSDWEEGIIEVEDNSFPNDKELRTKPSLKVSDTSEDSVVEWEEGDCDVREKSSYPAESRKPVSRCHLEEEADLQEAIRRSLKDLEGEAFSHLQPEHENVKTSEENPYEGVDLLDEEDNISGPNMLGTDCIQQNKSSYEILGSEKLDDVGEINNISQAFSSSWSHIKSSEPNDPETAGILISESCERYLGSNPGQLSQDVNKGKNLCREMPSLASGGPLEEKEIHLSVEQGSNIEDASHSTEAAAGDLPHAELIDERNDMEAGLLKLVHEEKISSEAEPSLNAVDITNSSVLLKESFPEDSANGSNFAQNLDRGKKSDDYLSERKCHEDKYALLEDENEQFDSMEAPNYENEPVDSMEASVEKEMLILGEEYMNLGDEQRKLERNAESVSTEMFAECQELLQMFGIPYIIAPMEAEAQCAYMELANLVDGVVTDDSDVFLFGAQSVYKNIFDDRKYVETYFMKDIEKELGLTREKLIRMALLLGSDYTEGISGIGIVNAIEVVTAFPEEDGLQKFREWIESPDPAILGKVDVQTGLNMRKKGSGDSDMNSTNNDKEGTFPSSLNIAQVHEEKQSAAHIQEIKQTFMDKHRNVSKNWHIPPLFPSQAVISEYSCPQVDKSTESFTWGKPDLHVLHRLCWEKFGWGIQKSDELLLPVLKEYDKHETQLRLEAFYTFNERFAKIRSKRIKKAVKGITKAQSSDIMDDPVEEASKSRRASRKSGNNKYEKPSKRTVKNAPDSKSNSMEKSNLKQSRKRTAEGPVLCDVENTEASGSRYMDRGSLRSGKGRGRGIGRSIERGRAKEGPSFEQSTSGSDDFECGDNGHEVPVEESSCLHELRRSTRSRKPISYSVDDLEIDDTDKSLDEGDRKGLDKLAVDQRLSCDQEAQRDDAAGINGNEQHKVGDSSLQSFSGDYLERGGGFCTDGEGVGLPVVSQNSSSPKDDVPSNDYLKMGGGFCVDESEERIAPDTAVQETGDSSKSGSEETDHRTEHLNELQQDGGKTNASDTRLNKDGVNITYTNGDPTVRVSAAENNEDNSGPSGLTGLSAIPFLRRKRRKG